MEKESKIITVAGKGGVGKTSLSACMVRLLTEAYPDSKILAIDADPAVGLSVALGVDVKMTLDDIRMGVVDSVENGEAGIEQIQRRVMEKVTHLVLVSDQSKKGIQVINTIKGVADDLIEYEKIGAVINRMTNPELADLIEIPGVDVIAKIPADTEFAANDIRGRSVMQLPDDDALLLGAKEALKNMGIL